MRTRDKKLDQEPWYGAKCIFLHTNIESLPGRVYEERIILVKATSVDEAISQAEQEAQNYAQDSGGCTYTGFIDVFHIFSEQIGDSTEIYSLMRRSDLNVKDYLDHFYDTGEERTQKER